MAGAQPFGNFYCARIVEIEPGDSVIGTRPGGLLLDVEGSALGIQHHDPVAFGISDPVAEHGRTARATYGEIEGNA